MKYRIRELRTNEYKLLDDFLYEAIFIPEGEQPLPRSVIYQPELQVYVKNFGEEKDDICFVAEIENENESKKKCENAEKINTENLDRTENTEAIHIESGKVVGAVWVRDMNDYGHVEDGIPSFAVSLYKEYRGYGIGTALMKRMLQELAQRGYKKASLSVQKANYAAKMYQKLGFEIVDENEEEYIMIYKL